MGRFDKEYFFVKHPGDEYYPELTPDEDTGAKPYRREALPFGQKPLIFRNGALEFALERGVLPVDPPPDVLFDGDDLVVRERIAKKLDEFEIPNLAIQPAIYIDHKKKWHEDYWFLTFTKEFDCWDREKSKYNPKPSANNPIRHNVYVFVLNEDLIQKKPLHERLLFKMGGATLSPVLAHKSIVGLFRMPGVEITSVVERAEMNGVFLED
ncbi:MAG: hypothetical protein LBE22_09520 [Azoarcus sp.]|jgi:hypothetical protein|nr:hypothetical protein [Azoarcus sp.]